MFKWNLSVLLLVVLLGYGCVQTGLNVDTESSAGPDSSQMVFTKVIDDSRSPDTGHLPGYCDWLTREFPEGYELKDGVVDQEKARRIASEVYASVKWQKRTDANWKTSSECFSDSWGNCCDRANAVLIRWREAGFSDYNILVIYLRMGDKAHCVPALVMNNTLVMMDNGEDLDLWTPVHCYNLETGGGWKF